MKTSGLKLFMTHLSSKTPPDRKTMTAPRALKLRNSQLKNLKLAISLFRLDTWTGYSNHL
jgi:hypothetical protein